MKQRNNSVTPKMIKNVIINLDSLKVSGSDCIPAVVLKNCEPELSYILAELFNKCPKESCFSRLLEGLIGGPCVEERSIAKNYRPVSILSVFSKVL